MMWLAILFESLSELRVCSTHTFACTQLKQKNRNWDRDRESVSHRLIIRESTHVRLRYYSESKVLCFVLDFVLLLRSFVHSLFSLCWGDKPNEWLFGLFSYTTQGICNFLLASMRQRCRWFLVFAKHNNVALSWRSFSLVFRLSMTTLQAVVF